MSSPQIFISYSSKDRKIVEQVHNTLVNQNNLDIWRDGTRLETNWSREIAYALADSDVLCLMWSENSSTSKWVKHEWLTARALEKRIIPILFHDAPKLPEPLHNLHGVHFQESNPEEACQEVVDRLRKSESFTEPYDYKVLPANSYIPFNPNPEFTGRHVELLELYLKMIGNLNKIGINQVGAVGMGGVGKTQLAVEFAYRFSFAFDNVFWIQAADVDQWRSEFVGLARDRLGLSISGPDKPDADKRYIIRLQKYCKDKPQTLIIMDNVIEPKRLNNDTYLDGLTPLSLGCNFLFTTRRHFRLTGITSQPVDVLSPQSAYELLIHNRKPITPEEDDHARVICNVVGCLPLAIILAAGYLNEYTYVSFSDYHDKLSKDKLDVIDIGELSEEELATRHDAAVRITYEEDWKNIADENARLLFKLAGQFGEAEIIPKARLGFLAGIGSRKSRLHGLLVKAFNMFHKFSLVARLRPSDSITSRKSKPHRPLDEAFNLLHKLSLAEKMGSDGRALRLHPLIRNFAQEKIPGLYQTKFRAKAAKNLQAAYFYYPHLKSEINARGVAEVLDDLQTAINWWGKGVGGLQDLRLLQNTLRLSFNQLTRDCQQLAGQLIGRLKKINTPNIKKLLDDAFESQKRTWFNPICCSLTPPGGPLIRTLEGHNGRVFSVAISPDGKTALSGSEDKTLKLWDLTSGRALLTLEGHSGKVSSVAISPDGKTAVSGSWDQTLNIWDLTSGRALHTLKGHKKLVNTVAISPDGKTVVSGSFDHTLNVWDLTSGRVLHTLEGHIGYVNAVAINLDGKTAVSGSDDNTLKLWDLTNGKALRTLEGHTDFVKAVAISPDGRTALSGSWDQTLKVWDLTSGRALHTLKERSSIKGLLGLVKAVAISPDGKTAVSGSDTQTTLKLWDLSNGKALHTLEGHSSPVFTVAISPDGKTAVSGSWDQTLKVWDLCIDQSFHTLDNHSGEVMSVAISPDGKTAVSGSYDNTLKLWDLTSGRALNTFEGHSSPVSTVAISPDGKTAVSGSWDQTLKLWDLTSGKALYTLQGHSRMVFLVAISSDGKTAVSCSEDETFKLWDLTSGRALHTIEAHSIGIDTVAISPDGKTVVSSSNDNTLKVWDLTSGRALQTLEGHSALISAVAINPNGNTAVTGSWDQTLKLWDLSSGRALHTIEAHCIGINTVAISPDGNTAVTGSWDQTLKLWDLRYGKVMTSFIGDSPISCSEISSCGKIAVAGERSGHIHFLRIEGI